MFKGIKLIIFDLDGTLVDAYDAIVASFNYTMRRMNLAARSYLTIKRAVGWGDRGLLRPFVPEEKLEEALKLYQAHHKKSLLKKIHLLPGVKKTLNYLKSRNYKLAIASNRPKAFSQIIIRKLKLSRFFDYILCGDQLKNPKPHPDIILKIMRRLSVEKKQTLYIGDMTIDVATGKNAGVKTIAVTCGSSTKKELAKLKPFILLPSVDKLVKIL